MMVPILWYSSACRTLRKRSLMYIKVSEIKFLKTVELNTRLVRIRKNCIWEGLEVMADKILECKEW